MAEKTIKISNKIPHFATKTNTEAMKTKYLHFFFIVFEKL